VWLAVEFHGRGTDEGGEGFRLARERGGENRWACPSKTDVVPRTGEGTGRRARGRRDSCAVRWRPLPGSGSFPERCASGYRLAEQTRARAWRMRRVATDGTPRGTECRRPKRVVAASHGWRSIPVKNWRFSARTASAGEAVTRPVPVLSLLASLTCLSVPFGVSVRRLLRGPGGAGRALPVTTVTPLVT